MNLFLKNQTKFWFFPSHKIFLKKHKMFTKDCFMIMIKNRLAKNCKGCHPQLQWKSKEFWKKHTVFKKDKNHSQLVYKFKI